MQGFPGHRDIVSGLAFRSSTHELFSASFDRSVKIWSLDDKAYVDTLLGHQAEVLSIDLLRQVSSIPSQPPWKSSVQVPASRLVTNEATMAMSGACRLCDAPAIRCMKVTEVH